MSEYLSRETVIAEIEKHLRIMGLTKHGIVYKTYSLAHEHIVELLRIIPAVDAVEVVRCRECKRYFAEDEYCDCLDTNMQPDEFCSIGKRRKDGDA